MKILRLDFKNYRNLKPGSIYPYENINVIYGDNAQGKTNIIEAIWLFTGGRSFRGAKDSSLVAFNEKDAKVLMEFNAQDREQKSEIIIENGKRSAKLNGISKPTASSLIGSFCAVIFSPVHLSLIKDGPAERRKFIDAAICQIKPSYASVLSRYNHIVSQRNTLLKDITKHPALIDTLDIWEDHLAKYGASIVTQRVKYIEELSKSAAEIYAGISDGKEQIEIRYKSAILKDGSDDLTIISEQIRRKLYESRKDDISLGYTMTGPHRDDLSIKVNGKSVRAYGSQGQQRSCVLAMKLSEATILKDSIGEKPIVLLDDVMSELDNFRQDYILNCIKGWQVFITCCDPSTVGRLAEGKKIYVRDGTCTQ